MDYSFFNPIIIAVEVNLAAISPEGATDCQKLFGTSIPLIMFQKISVAALLCRRTTGDHVYGDAPVNQSRERVDLLHEGRRLHQARPVSDNKLESIDRLPNCARD